MKQDNTAAAGRRGHRLRSAMLAVSVLVGASLSAAPSALAVEPDIIPAGFGCSFDVLFSPVPVLPGDHPHIGAGDITLTNMETGASILSKSRYVTSETSDAATNTLVAWYLGRRIYQFYPGDMGPTGQVGEPGALLRIDGFVRETYALDTEVITAFSYHGHVTDLCALLS